MADTKPTNDPELPDVRAGAKVLDGMGEENAIAWAFGEHIERNSNMESGNCFTKVVSLAGLKQVEDIERAQNIFEKETLSQPDPTSRYSKLFLQRIAIAVPCVLIFLVTVTIAATVTVLFTGMRAESPASMDVQNSSAGGLSVATSNIEVLMIHDVTDNSTGEVQSGVERSTLVQWLGSPNDLDSERYNDSYPLVQREVLWQLPSRTWARRNSEDDENTEFISVTLEYNMTTEMRIMLDECLGSDSCLPQVIFNETVNVETEDHGDISYTGLECVSDFCTFKTNTTNITDITNTNGTRRFFFFGLETLLFIALKASLKGALVKGGVGKAFAAAGKKAAGDLFEEGVKQGVKKLLPPPRRAPIVRGCFPADTFVMVCDRYGSPTPKPISSVQISEKVLTSKGCSPVYLMGHEDPTIMASFVQATTDTGHIFELTPYHYVMANNKYVHARNLKLGDTVKVGGKSTGLVKDILTDDIITHVQTVTRKGLYNPYTVAGDILVFAPASNQTLGVVASVHSDWFLEDYVEAARVPDIYQALLAPVRTIHSVHPKWNERFTAHFKNSTEPLDQHGFYKIVSVMAATF
mmetsp:Transcript_80451/g.130363  ORF Transcript_80451/g.130363 Transcript_80451/m.130363 type:complete len:580 (+) Transcript_80451:66-1805(+)